MDIKELSISSLKLNQSNPRFIKDDKFKKLVQSIKDFPTMLRLRPIIIDETFTILGGNMRYRASIEAGLKKVFTIQINDLSEQEKKEFIIKDNLGFGEWDFDLLSNEWNMEDLLKWGLDIPDFDVDEEKQQSFNLTIKCTNRVEQKELYDRLKDEGYEVKK
jgi:ParB-like chromosome segregation protein Spo0J